MNTTINNAKETILNEFKTTLADYRNPKNRENYKNIGWDKVLSGKLDGLKFAYIALGGDVNDIKKLIKNK